MANKYPTFPGTRRIDLTGVRFGRLVAQRPSSKTSENGGPYWHCHCDCGERAIVQRNNLTSRRTRSCGCLEVENRRKHGKVGSRVYDAWINMLQRCNNPKDTAYKHYGGRGITVCEQWHDFQAFYDDMGDPPEGRSLERINNNSGYCLENCRWATQGEQNRNCRRNHQLTFREKTQCLAAWAEHLGIHPNTLYYRLRRGWSVCRALSTPARQGNYRRTKVSL